MKVNCAVLGFPIEICAASGNHPLCRKCLATNVATSKVMKPRSIEEECKAKKRCECGRFFLMNSNRQIYCPKCQKRGYRKKARKWDWENRGNRSQTRELGAVR